MKKVFKARYCSSSAIQYRCEVVACRVIVGMSAHRHYLHDGPDARFNDSSKAGFFTSDAVASWRMALRSRPLYCFTAATTLSSLQ